MLETGESLQQRLHLWHVGISERASEPVVLLAGVGRVMRRTCCDHQLRSAVNRARGKLARLHLEEGRAPTGGVRLCEERHGACKQKGSEGAEGEESMARVRVAKVLLMEVRITKW